MKFIYITKPLPVFNKKFRENSGNPSSMFIYKKTGYKEKLRLLYSASIGQKMRSFVSECRLWLTILIQHSGGQQFRILILKGIAPISLWRTAMKP